MSALTAAIVLAWIMLTVLAFAMASVLHQVRDLRAAVGRQQQVRPALPDEARPQDGASYAVHLLVDESCPICAEVTPVFAELAAKASTSVDFVLLSATASSQGRGSGAVRALADGTAFQLLDPGWLPAVVVIDADGKPVLAEPAGSSEAIQRVIARITNLVGAST